MDNHTHAQPNTTRLALFSWAFYDWANSAFAAVIQTFVFAAYFVRHVSDDETLASAQWGFAIGLAGLIVALLGPIFGAIADQGKNRKVWLISFTYLCIIPTALMWFILPDPWYVLPALGLIIISTIGSEFANIFYNAMLPGLVPESHVGRWSGWGWGLGYLGGMACLAVSLILLVNGDNSVIHFSGENAQNVRSVFVIVAVWYFVFSFPVFLFTPDAPSHGKHWRQAIRDGWKQLKKTVMHIRQYRHIGIFLIARVFYADALATLFAFGGIYAAATFNMSEREVLLFGIGLNISAGLGSLFFAWIDDWFGSRSVILFSLINLTGLTAIMLLVTNYYWFWCVGLMLGIFVGPVQASSRALLARMAPKHLVNEMFGFYALSGKATAFLGPMLVGWLTLVADSQRIGMAVILVFFCAGACILTLVPRQKRVQH